MRKVFTILCFMFLTSGTVLSQTVPIQFSFRKYLEWMSYGHKGLSIAAYKKHAASLGLNLIHHSEERSEIYMVWGSDIGYEKGNLTETYVSKGDNPCCFNLDLTPNGKNLYSPISISLVFPDSTSQQRFWDEGIRLGCQKLASVEPTEVDATWTDVHELRYIGNPKTQVSWRYILFYQKDNLYMCTFLF